MSFFKPLCSSQMFGKIVDQESLVMEIEKLDVLSVFRFHEVLSVKSIGAGY